MSSLWIDIRYALRMLAKSPRLTAVLLVTLALGIGASTTIFSVVNSVVLQPLAYQAPDRLIRVYTELSGKINVGQLGVTIPGYQGLALGCRTCGALGAWWENSVSLASGDRAVRVQAAFVTHSLLPTLGVRPVLGRLFDDKEDQPGPAQVVVIGYDVWQRVFAGDPGIVGKQIHMDAAPVTVVGVMPRGFSFPQHQEAWVPARVDYSKDKEVGSFSLSVLVRLAPDASPASLGAELAGAAKGWTDALNIFGSSLGFPPMTVHVHAVALQADLVGSLATTLWLLQAAVLFVLLISIVNVANLLLARSETRTREVAIRHALGATRRRLLRQFITESLILGLAGGGLGILVALWALDGVTALIPREAPRVEDIALDASAVVFAVACSVVAALVFGLAPILHARRTDIHGALKDGSPRMTGSKARLRVRRGLVIGELALAVVLVVGCSVMVRSFLRLQQVEPGFAPDHLLTFGTELPKKSYPAQAVATHWHRLHDRMRALPGVRAAGLLGDLPPKHDPNPNGILFPGRTAGAQDEPDWLTDYIQLADSDALDTIGARIVRGRSFAASDTPETPLVAMVNESFAAKFFRGRDPIGQQIKVLVGHMPVVTVVGVVADIKRAGLDRPAGTELILALWQCPAISSEPDNERQMYTVLRTTGDPAELIPAVQRAAAEIDPMLPVFALRTMDDVMWEAVARPRFLMFLLTSFAGIALVLAAVGIYGVMAHTVAQRTHEIGLRVALGARPSQVRAMVLRQAASLVAVGVGVGLAAAIALSAILGASLRELFYGASLTQPLVLIAVAVAVTATALLATWIPARRATLVEPTIALRAE